jgi:hypothetical protein
MNSLSQSIFFGREKSSRQMTLLKHAIFALNILMKIFIYLSLFSPILQVNSLRIGGHKHNQNSNLYFSHLECLLYDNYDKTVFISDLSHPPKLKKSKLIRGELKKSLI